MKPPKISIVIPSYNKVRFIGQTLSSIFNQNYPNLEVIIQDGGSTDGTVDIIREFAKKNKIIWVSKKDNGQLDAINKGFKKATGKILTFINADDVYAKESFYQVVKAYKNNSNALWFAGKGTVINSKGMEIAKSVTLYKNLLLSLNSRYWLLTTNYLIQPSVFITKKAYKNLGNFTGTKNFVMEYDSWLKLSKKQMPVIINKDLSKFRIESATKTKTMSKDLLNEDWKIVNRYTKSSIILTMHKFNNLTRLIVEKFV